MAFSYARAAKYAVLSDFAPHLDSWLAALARRPLTLAHADVRVDNLVFPERGGVRIVDWQTAMRTGGVTDLAILLATSTTVDDRRAWEGDLLLRYRDGVARHGIDLDLEELRTGYADSFLWWSSMFANNLSTIDPPPGRGSELFDSMVSRTARAADGEVDRDFARHRSRRRRPAVAAATPRSVASRSPYPVNRRSNANPSRSAQARAFAVRSGSSICA